MFLESDVLTIDHVPHAQQTLTFAKVTNVGYVAFQLVSFCYIN